MFLNNDNLFLWLSITILGYCSKCSISLHSQPGRKWFCRKATKHLVVHLLEVLLHGTKVLTSEVGQQPKRERVSSGACCSSQPGQEGDGGGAQGEERGQHHQLGEAGRPVGGGQQGQRPCEVVCWAQLDDERPDQGVEGEVVGKEEEGY